MTRIEPIIGVNDVKESSRWYQTLLNCKSNHGGNTFEILTNEAGHTILCLHQWGEHEHPTLSSPKVKPGNGLILYFRVDDLDVHWKNAKHLNATIEEAPHLNQNSGEREFSLRDRDGYFITVST
ncbi:glyoxalase [Fulvivirga ulvae]|uniref:VOC family protein n=1 Tax=Fulvivirga ulvae TaxID=2904245 RepID=UPI001F164EF2|nr:VOC family protein [Fulvivirga ulvae]UII33671.1 glyoxalase [Fulvivirga ulvae]